MPRATPAIPSKAKINDRFASVKKGSELTQRTGPIDRQNITFRTLALFLAICLLNVLPQCGHITAVSDTWRPHSGQVVNAISCCFCCTTGPPVRYYLIKKRKRSQQFHSVSGAGFDSLLLDKVTLNSTYGDIRRSERPDITHHKRASSHTVPSNLVKLSKFHHWGRCEFRYLLLCLALPLKGLRMQS